MAALSSADRRKLEAQATALLAADKPKRAPRPRKPKPPPPEPSTTVKRKRTVEPAREHPDLPVMATTREVFAEQAKSQVFHTSHKNGFNLKGVADVLIEHGLNPAEEILRVMPQLEPDVKARMMATLLEYIQPKLKSIELTGKDGGPVEIKMTPEERASRISLLQEKLSGFLRS